MQVYIGRHNLQHEQFYKLLTESETLREHTFVSERNVETGKDLLNKCKVMIADVSSPTIDLGIEMGWADVYKVDIICTCVKGTAISSHLTRMSTEIITYTELTDLIEKIEFVFKTKYH